MSEVLTAAEKTVAEHDPDGIRRSRERLQTQMADHFTGIVTEVGARRVKGHRSETMFDHPDLAVEIFALDTASSAQG